MIFVRFSHPAKANSPIIVNLLHDVISIRSSVLLSKKAFGAISHTEAGNITFLFFPPSVNWFAISESTRVGFTASSSAFALATVSSLAFFSLSFIQTADLTFLHSECNFSSAFLSPLRLASFPSTSSFFCISSSSSKLSSSKFTLSLSLFSISFV